MQTITSEQPGAARAAAALTYSAVCYVLFLGTFLAFVAFVGGLLPRPLIPISPNPALAGVIDMALVLMFGLQHSAMARPRFKRAWTRIVSEPVERATYVLAASIMLAGLIAFWQPIPGMIWSVDSAEASALLWAVFACGWSTVLFTTFLIDHFELFGLRQAWAYATGRLIPPSTFKTPNVYKLVRHPMQLGFVIAFWAAPVMTFDRFALAALMTTYIAVALIFEERDLVGLFGDQYRAYQRAVPRLLLRPWRIAGRSR
jgi:protein-S-isoprenylcysteine O-methyltransferase Ste14